MSEEWGWEHAFRIIRTDTNSTLTTFLDPYDYNDITIPLCLDSGVEYALDMVDGQRHPNQEWPWTGTLGGNDGDGWDGATLTIKDGTNTLLSTDGPESGASPTRILFTTASHATSRRLKSKEDKPRLTRKKNSAD